VRIAFVGNFSVDYTSETHHAKSLESLGHEVVRLQERAVTGHQILDEASRSDLLIFVHTHGWTTPGRLPLDRVLNELNSRRIPTVTYHLDRWMGLPRQSDLEHDPFYRSIGWFFTCDAMQAELFNENTAVKGRYLPAGVFGDECYPAEPDSPHGNDVIFVGSKNYHPIYPYRPQLVDWLRRTYGVRFTHVGGDGDTGTIRGHELNRVYASSKVAVGDSLCLDPGYAGKYWSDRVYESIGRFGFIIHPRLHGLDSEFTDGKHLATYEHGNFIDLRMQIDFYLSHSAERENIRRAGHEHVKNNFTYRHRWESILDTVFG
jgi:hypothetical protein